MNKYVSRLADHYGLAQLHRKRSRQSQFAPPLKLFSGIHDSALFYPCPGPCDITFQPLEYSHNYQMGKFVYPSEFISDFSNNNLVTGLYYQCKWRHQDTPSFNPLNVIIVHGWRMDSLERVQRLFLKSFLGQRYNIYFFTLPYHFERTPETSLYNGEMMISANIDRTLAAVRQGVSDLRALIRWLKNSGGKVAVIGISLGGLITNLTCVFEEQVDALISVFYANSLADSVWKTIPGKYLKQDFQKHGFTYEELKECWQITAASNFKPCLPQDNILLMSGEEDQYIDAGDSETLWKAWDQPRRIVYPCGHSGIVLLRKKISADASLFLKTVCRSDEG